MGLSDLEKRILKHYSAEGMDIPVGESASKALRVSPQTLRYKLRRLEERNILLGYSYRLDYRKLGIGQPAWFFVSRRDKSVDPEALMNDLLGLPEIQLCAVVTGPHDLALKVFARGIREMTSFSLKLQKDFRERIKAIDISFVGRIVKWHQKTMPENFSQFRLQKNDAKILSCKLRDPSKRLSECAKETGLHKNTVSQRWKKMVSEGLILKKSMMMNPEFFHDLDMGLNALMFFESEAGETENLASGLSSFHEVHELGIVHSRFDLVASIRVRDVPALYSFQNILFDSEQLNRLISSTQTIVILASKTKRLERRGDLLGLIPSKSV